MTDHRINIKVYYEDTDAGGVVYYANYLRYLERARTEFLLDRGLDVYSHHRKGRYFVVTRVDIRYRLPARLGDTIEVITRIGKSGGASMTFGHQALRGTELLCEAEVSVAYIDDKGRPLRLPEDLSALF